MNYFYFQVVKNFSFNFYNLFICTLLGTVTSDLIFNPKVLAFSIDFKNPAVINTNGTRSINYGVDLEANDLDSAGGQSIDLDLSDSNPAQTYNTTQNNIGELWNPIGIDITATGGNLGLFDSECVPHGGSNSAAAPDNNACDNGNNHGDPDLATGDGVNPNGSKPDVNFKTTPQGNLLIVEENSGDGVPDDDGGGDIIVDFTHDNILSQVRLESVVIVDDAEGDIIVTFTDNTTETVKFNSSQANTPITSTNGSLLNSGEYVGGENALAIVGGFTQQDIKELEIDFVGSGGFGAFAFSEFAGNGVEVPFEFSPGLGLLLSGVSLLGVKLLKNKHIVKSQSNPDFNP